MYVCVLCDVCVREWFEQFRLIVEAIWLTNTIYTLPSMRRERLNLLPFRNSVAIQFVSFALVEVFWNLFTLSSSSCYTSAVCVAASFLFVFVLCCFFIASCASYLLYAYCVLYEVWCICLCSKLWFLTSRVWIETLRSSVVCGARFCKVFLFSFFFCSRLFICLFVPLSVDFFIFFHKFYTKFCVFISSELLHRFTYLFLFGNRIVHTFLPWPFEPKTSQKLIDDHWETANSAKSVTLRFNVDFIVEWTTVYFQISNLSAFAKIREKTLRFEREKKSTGRTKKNCCQSQKSPKYIDADQKSRWFWQWQIKYIAYSVITTNPVEIQLSVLKLYNIYQTKSIDLNAKHQLMIDLWTFEQ